MASARLWKKFFLAAFLVLAFLGLTSMKFSDIFTSVASQHNADLRIAKNRADTVIFTLGVESIDGYILFINQQIVPWGVDRIGAEFVHSVNKGAGVKVAVLDTGIDLDHPDLSVAGDVTVVPGTINGDDDNGHGTAVAGIIAALDNDIGVVGVAPDVELYSVKVLNKSGSGSVNTILSGIQWAIENKMQVINVSFGCAGEMPACVVQSLENAYKAGIVIVAAAGSGGNIEGMGENIWAPARYDSVISVGATNVIDSRYSTSSTGSKLNLVAPGYKVFTTGKGGGYLYFMGTSASSPHVAGAAALLIASGINNVAVVKEVLDSSAKDLGDIGYDNQYGYGLLNVANAIDSVQTTYNKTVEEF